MHPGRFPPSVENPQTVTNAAGIEGLEAPGEPRKGPDAIACRPLQAAPRKFGWILGRRLLPGSLAGKEGAMRCGGCTRSTQAPNGNSKLAANLGEIVRGREPRVVSENLATDRVVIPGWVGARRSGFHRHAAHLDYVGKITDSSTHWLRGGTRSPASSVQQTTTFSCSWQLCRQCGYTKRPQRRHHRRYGGRRLLMPHRRPPLDAVTGRRTQGPAWSASAVSSWMMFLLHGVEKLLDHRVRYD